MTEQKDIELYDRSHHGLRKFSPIDPQNVRVYFCGPTVYDQVHLGNLRAMFCADLLVRTLRAYYPKVTFVRNITDIDDKIIRRAAENGEEISHLTERMTELFHQNTNALAILPPDIEPKATAHISEMIAIIKKLVEKGHAYKADNQIFFNVQTCDTYGALSGRTLENELSGARIEISEAKKNPQDFVLWKPSSENEPGWENPFGRGRPGWHIECSAMAHKYLGESFDIHGGGSDLLFPHHENERAQSLCCFDNSNFAQYWVHSGMLTINGEKMSKSLGNFFTVQDALERAPGEALRLLFLMTHYRSPLDFTWEKLAEAKKTLDRFYRVLGLFPQKAENIKETDPVAANFLRQDLNTSLIIAELHALADKVQKQDENSAEAAQQLYHTGQFVGLFQVTPEEWFQSGNEDEKSQIEALIEKRNQAKKARDFQTADAIRDDLAKDGIILEDTAKGTVWRKA
ncbi:cysteine--tRNA ligase [Acetobacteraceae bacterium]|nr:cysteine--tRNA ligase [Acetobacteraceae bacterium]